VDATTTASHSLRDWVGWFARPSVGLCLVAFSVAAVAASALLVPRFLASLPPDYLRSGKLAHAHGPVVRFLRNCVGVALFVLGVAMLVLPGQGLLTLLVGLLLLDFPGKHRLLVRLLSRPAILRVVNQLRGRRGAPPLSTC
jgi:Putative transmembrane protein (PGPGW)